MSRLVQDFLQKISTDSGFFIFVAIVVFAYMGTWYIFLYERRPKPAIKRKQEAEETEEEKKQPRAKQKQPVGV